MPHDHLNAPKHLLPIGEIAEDPTAAHEADPPRKFSAHGASKVGFETITACAFCPFVGPDACPLTTELSVQEKQQSENDSWEAQ